MHSESDFTNLRLSFDMDEVQNMNQIKLPPPTSFRMQILSEKFGLESSNRHV